MLVKRIHPINVQGCRWCSLVCLLIFVLSSLSASVATAPVLEKTVSVDQVLTGSI